MTQASISRWSRRNVLAGAGFLVAWQVALLADVPVRTGVVLGLYGFVLHVVFGKAYSLVPSYFDRTLSLPRAPPIQVALTVPGVVALAAAPLAGVSGWVDVAGALAWVDVAGALAWVAGVGVFLAAIGWTIRDNLAGRETGTSEANADRRPIDRAANLLIPIALAYLVAGAVATVALALDVFWPVGARAARVTHLLAAGAVTTLLFGVGFRLLPRFLVVHPRRVLVAVALPTGAVGPLLLALTLWDGGWFTVAAIVEATAVTAFALAVLDMILRSDRRRVGFYAVAAGALAGVAGVSLGLSFALVGADAGLIAAHRRLNLLGFLGLTIVGVAYQFYPPGVAQFRGGGDRTALASIGCLAGGLVGAVTGLVADIGVLTTVGEAVSLLGALAFAGLVIGLFWQRHWSG